MAIIACWECGGDVSDSAAACPHCGAPAKKEQPETGERPAPVGYDYRFVNIPSVHGSSEERLAELGKYTGSGWEVVSMATSGMRGEDLLFYMRRPKDYREKLAKGLVPPPPPPKRKCQVTVEKRLFGGYAVTKCGPGDYVRIPFRAPMDSEKDVTEIAAEAFAYVGIEEVEIPRVITAIGDRAFLGCRKLRQAVLYDGVKKIGAGVFTGCPDGLRVYYRGSAAQWAAVKKAGDLSPARVVFYSESPAKGCWHYTPDNEIAGW